MDEENRMLSLALERKGYTEEYMCEIQDSSHGDLLDVEKFSGFLYSHRDLVYTVLQDFDTDGSFSGILGFAGFSEMGFKCRLYTPFPDMGYGFGRQAIDLVMRAFPDTQVIVTCDQGIDCHEGIAYAKSLGLYVLVTDHHPMDEKKPLVCGDVVVDPMRPEDPYGHPEICGAYVFWQCLYDYAKRYGTPFMRTQIWRLRVFAGIATVGDQMPMLYENRQLVQEAIDFCNMVLSDENGLLEDMVVGCPVYRDAFYGLSAFVKLLGERKKISEVDEGTFGFYISPMVNAVKRMCTDMGPLYRLFFGCRDEDEREDAFGEIFNINEERKVAVKAYYEKILEEMEGNMQPYAPYVYLSEAPPKILGLLASKLQDLSEGPVLALKKKEDGTYGGSGRSPDWLDMREVMKGIPGGMAGLELKGHAHAFAMTAKSEPDLGRVVGYWRSLTEEWVSKDTSRIGLPKYDLAVGDDPKVCDFPFSLLDVVRYAYGIRKFGPFGNRFERPSLLFVLDMRGLELSRIGKGRQHVKCVHVVTGFPFLSWNQDLDQVPCHDGYLWAKGDVELSEFNGETFIQFTGKFV